MWEPRPLATLGVSTACNRDIFIPFYVGRQFQVFLIGIETGGVQWGPLGIAVTNRPIVPTPSDYDDGEIGWMMIGRGNQSTQRKPAPVPLCLPQTPHAARTQTRIAAFV
jgi:hypothetical protein